MPTFFLQYVELVGGMQQKGSVHITGFSIEYNTCLSHMSSRVSYCSNTNLWRTSNHFFCSYVFVEVQLGFVLSNTLLHFCYNVKVVICLLQNKYCLTLCYLFVTKSAKYNAHLRLGGKLIFSAFFLMD